MAAMPRADPDDEGVVCQTASEEKFWAEPIKPALRDIAPIADLVERGVPLLTWRAFRVVNMGRNRFGITTAIRPGNDMGDIADFFIGQGRARTQKPGQGDRQHMAGSTQFPMFLKPGGAHLPT